MSDQLARHRSGRDRGSSATAISLAIGLAIGLFAGTSAYANPQGGNVVHGNAQFATPNASTLNITNTPGAIINWQSFGIGANETTRFIQNNAASAVLNRVTGNTRSDIMGSLLSNGRVFLINPNGILFGANSVVDTAGLVASTLDMTDADFLAGRLTFSGDETSGAITNRGYIKTGPGGEIVLIAPKILNESVDGIENSGLIETEGGELILAAGRQITINSLDDVDITFDVQAPEDEVVNLGQLLARGGVAAVLAGTIRHSGEINADSISVDAQGRVVLAASSHIDIATDSVISASGGEDLAGGSIKIGAHNDDATTTVTVAGRVAVNGTEGGTVIVTGDEISLNGANVTANGARAGGAVRVGGDFAGGDSLPRATNTTVDADSRLEANANEAGDGGSVVVWAEETANFDGYVAARGGVESGDGGAIEISGKQGLFFKGTVDVGAPGGEPGTLIFDPKNITLVPGGGEEEIFDVVPTAGDRFGSSFSVLSNGNLLVTVQNGDVGGLADAGKVFLFTPGGQLIGTLTGNAMNERLGSFGFTTAPGGGTNLVFRSPFAANGAALLAGAIILFNPATGTEVSRLSGQNAGDSLGLSSFFTRGSGNLVVPVPNASPLGMNEGTVFLTDANFNIIGQVNGNTLGEFFGNSVDTFTLGFNDFLVYSPTGSGGAGDIVRIADVDLGMGNIERGRLTGATPTDAVGSLTFSSVRVRASGNLVVRVPTADPLMVNNAGTVFLTDPNLNLIGQINGNTANEALGNTVDFFTLGSGDYLITSTINSAGAGAIIRGSDVDLGMGNIEVARITGQSPGDALGSRGFFTRGSGNLVIPVPNASPLGMNEGTVFLTDLNLNLIGQVNGNTLGEFFGNNVDQFTLGFNDFLVYSPTGSGGAGDIVRIADVDLGMGNIERGRLTGATPTDAVGSLTFSSVSARSSGNLVVRVPTAENMSVMGADPGTVFLTDPNLNVIGQINGNTPGERLGDNVDFFTLGSGDYLITSTGNSAGAGAIIRGSDVDLGMGNIEVARITGQSPGDALGSRGFFTRGSGNLVIPVPNADPLMSNEGTVFLTDLNLNLIGQVNGNTLNEFFGNNVDQFTLGFTDFLVYSPTGSGGAGDIVRIADVDLGMGNIERGRLTGATPTDALGSLFFSSVRVRGSGNLVVRVPTADPLMVNNAGTVFLTDPNLNLIGQINGNTANEALGNTVDFFTLGSGDYLITSTGNSAGAGAIIRGSDVDLGMGNIEVARITGQSPGDALGSRGFFTRGSGNLVIPVPNASPLGMNEGTVFLTDLNLNLIGQVNGNTLGEFFGNNVDQFTLGFNDFLVYSPTGSGGAGDIVRIADINLGMGNIERGRLTGATPTDAVGSLTFSSVTMRSNGNLVVRVPTADPAGMNSGTVFVTDANLNIIGQINGNAMNEQLGNTVDFFSLGSNTLLISSPMHNNGALTAAGAIIAAADSDLGGGNIERWRIQGESANDMLGDTSSIFQTDTFLIRIPNADTNPVDAGRVILADKTTGQELGRTDGQSAGEQLGANFPNIVNSDFYFRVPDAANGPLMNAGAIVQVSGNDGTQVQRVVGTSANERLGNFSPTILSDGRLLYRSPDADVMGQVDAGRIVFLDPTGGSTAVAQSLEFTTNPGGDSFVGSNAITNFLNTGGTLVLQSNNDFNTVLGADIVADSGGLSITAGRSVNINSDIVVPNISIVANATQGLDPAQRDPGPGNFTLTAHSILGDVIDISAENISLFGGSEAVILATTSLSVTAANQLLLQGGFDADSIAALVSLGELTINADTIELIAGEGANADAVFAALGGVLDLTFNSCIGCDDLGTDPLLDPTTQTGIFVSNFLLDPAIDALLALGEPWGELVSSDEEEEDEEETVGECN